jgi:hypothetical protein
LSGGDHAAFFQTSPGPDGRRAVVKLVLEAGAGGAATLDLWHRTRQLRHPNLVGLLDCGRADHGGEIVFYAVFESPDDTLASALTRSPLNQLESREVLDSILNALRYLHAQGLVHGALEPDHIVAVGDRVKLSTDALREAETSSAYRKDVRLLGELWQQVLLPASTNSAEIAAHAADPDPDARWTLAEIAAALEPLPITPLPITPLPITPLPVIPMPPTAPPPGLPVTVSPPIPEPPVSTPLVPPVSAPPVTVRNDTNDAPPVPLSRPRPRERATLYGLPKWIWAGAAGVVVLILGLHWRHPADAPSESRVASVSFPVEAPAPAPVPMPTSLPKTATPKPTVPAAPKPSAAGGKEMWRVIAFTYSTRTAAAKKVQQLNQDHPGLNAAIFRPRDRGSYYLVSLGGRMTHEDAVRLQRTARGKGLPRDLYVQNYLE